MDVIIEDDAFSDKSLSIARMLEENHAEVTVFRHGKKPRKRRCVAHRFQ